MKTTLVSILLISSLCISMFAQQANDRCKLNKKQKYNLRKEPCQHQSSEDDKYKLRYGDREIPISTHDGQSPNEPQLEIIKKTLTDDFLVNDTIHRIGWNFHAVIDMDSLGNFAIAWENRDGYIFFQRFNANGLQQGSITKVNNTPIFLDDSDPILPSLAMDRAGNVVIVWMDDRNGNWDIYYQRYNSSGVSQGINQKVNDDAGTADQWYPSISMDESGNFVIAWGDSRNNNFDIYYQRYNSSGVNQGINQKANDDAGTANQYFPSISMDGSGNFVIVWDDRRNGNWDIYYQRYNSSGVKIGINQKANDDAGTAWQDYSSISMDGSGNFVIVWEDWRKGNSDIYYQRYNSSGVSQGVNQKANDDAGTARQLTPSISMDGAGNFVIVWTDERNGDDYFNSDIYYQRYNSSGVIQGVNQRANDDAGTESQYDPSISMDEEGNFVIAWADHRNNFCTNNIYEIYFQQYNSTGTPQGVNNKAPCKVGMVYDVNPVIAMDGNGNFVIAWVNNRDTAYSNLYYQRYDSAGTALGVNSRVVDIGCNNQYSPSISIDGGGNFVIVWGDDRNGNSDIYYQRYNSSGVIQGVNQKANDDFGTEEQRYPSISMDGAGNFAIVWEDDRNGNSDIYYQRYNSSGVKQGVNQKANDDAGTAYQGHPSISMDGSGNFVIAWTDSRNVSSNYNSDIYYQRYNSSGVNQGINQKANDDAGTESQYSPSISMDGSGNFVIVWSDNRNVSSNYNSDIYYQRYNSSGVNQGVNQKANDDAGTESQYDPSISMDGSGNFVIVWTDRRNGTNNPPNVMGQRYYDNGNPYGGNYPIVNDGQNFASYEPVVAANSKKIIYSWIDNRRLNQDIYAKIVSWDWGGVPVELKSFKASVLGNSIELSWTTASEKNNRGFEIERSKDRISFIKIGFVEGKGTTTIAQNYTFTDKLLEVSGMKLYYRLKQIDYDGTFIYSDIAEVEIAPINFSLSQNYPNPFNPSTSIQYQVSSNSHVSLKVYDVLGNEVATLVDEYKPAGSYEVEYSARDGQESGIRSASGGLASGIGYASGVYFYQLKAGEFVETKKMMLLR